MHLSTLIREVSFCSQWQLTQRPTTGQDEKIEKLWNAHVCVCMHVCGGRGEIRGCLCELVFSLVSAAVLCVQVIGSLLCLIHPAIWITHFPFLCIKGMTSRIPSITYDYGYNPSLGVDLIPYLFSKGIVGRFSCCAFDQSRHKLLASIMFPRMGFNAWGRK